MKMYMKKFLFLSLATFIFSFSSCTNDDLEGVNRVTSNISAIIEEGGSRTVLDDLQVKWGDNEAISVFYTSDTYSTPQNVNCQMTDGSGTTSANFSIVLEGTKPKKLAALYPYSSDSEFSDNAITLTMPETHQYAENGISGAPMAALISDQQALIAFKNAGALLGITVNNIPAGYDRATLVSTTEPIAGKCTIEFDTNGNPTLKAVSDATEKQIEIHFEASDDVSNKTFYFPIPVDEYTSLEMSISKSSDSNSKKLLKTKALDAERSSRYKSTLTLDAITGAIPTSTTIEGASTALKSNNSITVDEVSSEDGTPTITLPTETAASEVNIVFESITSTGVITIDAANDSQVASNVNITVPTAADQAKLNIDLPNSTVTITVSGTSGTISELTASTAENTLIIGKGVSIGSLIIDQGNVRIEGGKITTYITNNNNKEIVYVIADQTDADTYKGLSDAVKASITKIECTSDIWVEVNTASGLYAASLGAKNIKLVADVTITADKPVNPKNGQIYDLNDCKVVAVDGTKDVFRIVEADAEVTIANGTIDNQNGKNYALSIRADNVTLNMEGVTIPANSYDGSLHKNGNYTGSTVSLVDCKFNGVVYLSNTDDKTANTLKVDGGSFTSATQNCFELLNTNATISNATLTNTLEEQKYTANGNSGNSFSNPQGYCIAFTNNDGKAAKGSATLSGNTYSVADKNGSYIFNQMNGATLNMEVSRFKEFAEVAAAGGKIKLLEDIVDAVGLSINKNLTVDFNNKTYTMSKPGAGSAGTQTLGFQLLKGNKIIFKNGTIKCSDANKDFKWESNATVKGIAMMIQNYANLTLEGMTIDGTNIAHNGSNTRYIVSFNSDVNLIGKTNITALDKDVAFDVCQYASYPAPVVNVETKGTIQGLVEVSGGTLNVKAGTFKNENGHCVKVVTGKANFSGGNFEAQEVAVFNMAGTVNITDGVFTSNDNAVISGNGTNDAKYQNGTIDISGGTFNAKIKSEGYVACGIYHPQRGTLKVTGGTFNVEKGCGILMRGGSLDMNGSKASFKCTGSNTGKVGDSRVVVPCGQNIVKDAYSAYYDAANITIKGVDEQYIYNVVNQQ